MRKKSFATLLVGILVSAFMLYLGFRNVPLTELITYLGTIRYTGLAPSVALVVLAFVLRAFRWRLILKDAIALNFSQAYHPLMIGFMINSILPGRMGELARPVILKKKHGLAFGTGLATVAAERAFDIFVLIGLFAAVFGTITGRPELDVTFGGIHLNSRTLQTVAWAMIRIGVILLIGLALLSVPASRRLMLRTIARLIQTADGDGTGVPMHLRRLGRFTMIWIENFAEGLRLIRHPRRMAACVLLSVLIWAAGILSFYVFAVGCPGIDLTVAQMAVFMTVICFFIALPSVPGYWGLWEAGGVFALSLFGIPAKDAAGFTLVTHVVQLFPVILLGWMSAIFTGANIWRLSVADEAASAES